MFYNQLNRYNYVAEWVSLKGTLANTDKYALKA